MKIKITLLLFFITFVSFAQFPGERYKGVFYGPDNESYAIKDVIEFNKALNGETFRSALSYRHKSVLENISDGLTVVNTALGSKDGEIKSSEFENLPNKFNGFKGKIKYFKINEIDSEKHVFAIVKIANSENRIAIDLKQAILNGEIISKSKEFKPIEVIENKELEELKLKSFSSDFNIKLLNVKGDKNTQTVKIEFLISHKLVHQDVFMFVDNKLVKAYDFEGSEYNAYDGYNDNTAIASIGSNNNLSYISYEWAKGGKGVINKIPTNVPVKCSIVFKKVLPKVNKLSFTSIKFGYVDSGSKLSYRKGVFGNIEIQNLDIDWEN